MQTFLNWVGWQPLGSKTPANPQVVLMDAGALDNNVSAILARIRAYARAYDGARLFIVVFAAHEWTPPQARDPQEGQTRSVRDASIQLYDRLDGQANPLGPGGVTVWLDSPSAYPTFLMHNPVTGRWSARDTFTTRHMQVAGEAYVRIALWVARLATPGGSVHALNIISTQAPGGTLRTLLAILLALGRGDDSGGGGDKVVRRRRRFPIMWLDTTLLINRFLPGGDVLVSDADILWALMLCSPDYVQPTLPRAWGGPTEMRQRALKTAHFRIILDKEQRTLTMDPEELHRIITNTQGDGDRVPDVTLELHEMQNVFIQDSPLILIVWELERGGFPSIAGLKDGDIEWLKTKGPIALQNDDLQIQGPVQRVIEAYDAAYAGREAIWEGWDADLPAHRGDIHSYVRDNLVGRAYGRGPFTKHLTNVLLGIHGRADRWGLEWWWPDAWSAAQGLVQRLAWNAIYLLLATDTLAACFWADQGTFYLSLDQEGPTGWGWTLRGQQLYIPRAGEGGVSSYQAIYAAAEASRARAGAQCWQADKAYPISDWIFTKKMIEPIRGLPTWFWLIILRDIPDKAYDPLVLQWELTWRARFLTQTTAEGRDATEVLLKLIGDTWDGTLVADSAQIPWETWAAILVRISAGGPEARDAWRAFTAKPSWPRKLADLRAYDELADAWEVNCDVHLSALSKTHLDLLAVDPFRPVELIVRIGSPCGVVGWAKGIDDITGLSFCASMGSLEDGQWQAIKAVSPASMLNVWNWRVWSWVQRWNEYLSLASNPAPLQSATMIGWEAQSLNLLPDLYGTLAERGKIRQNIPENPTFLRDFLLAWDLRDAWISGEHTERLLLTWEAHNHWLTYALDSTYQGYQGFTLLPIGGPEAGQLWIVSEDYFQTPASDLVQRPPNKVTIPLAKGIDYLVDPEDHDHVLAMVFTGWQPKMASKFWRVYGSDIAQWRDNGGWSEDTLSHIATRVLQLWGTSKYVQPYKDFYLRYFHQGSGGRRSK